MKITVNFVDKPPIFTADSLTLQISNNSVISIDIPLFDGDE